MKLEIRKIHDVDYEKTYKILSNSYPDMSLPKDKAFAWFDKIRSNFGSREFWGGFIGTQQVSVFVTNNFTLNYRGKFISAGGIGMVAVDLLHKKEKICKEMIEFYENYYLERGTSLLVLYPFRPDFYHKMGFGFGSTLHSYSIEPQQFSRFPKTDKLEYANEANLSEITNFYNQQVMNLHGAMLREEREFEGWLSNPKMRCLIHRENNDISGYLFFYFSERLPHDKGSFDLIIKEMQFKSVDVWRQLSTFLNTQSDQVKRIQYTTYDQDFYHYVGNPTNETKLYHHPIHQNISVEKTGLMYKIAEPKMFFEQLASDTFSKAEVIIRFELENELSPKNEKFILTYDFHNKIFVTSELKTDLTIKMNLARFSSIMMGALSFKTAVRHGLVEISKEKYIDCVDNLFRTMNKPEGYNEF